MDINVDSEEVLLKAFDVLHDAHATIMILSMTRAKEPSILSFIGVSSMIPPEQKECEYCSYLKRLKFLL